MVRPNRKGKPSERMGRKAFDLRIVFSNEFVVFSFPKYYKLLTTKQYYGGWVAEVRQYLVFFTSPLFGLNPYLQIQIRSKGMLRPKGGNSHFEEAIPHEIRTLFPRMYNKGASGSFYDNSSIPDFC